MDNAFAIRTTLGRKYVFIFGDVSRMKEAGHPKKPP
jgi:hypothetical protein